MAEDFVIDELKDLNDRKLVRRSGEYHWVLADGGFKEASMTEVLLYPIANTLHDVECTTRSIRRNQA